MPTRAAIALIAALAFAVTLLLPPAIAQEDAPLAAPFAEIIEGVGVFGEPVQTVSGALTNNDNTAYSNISVTAQVFDASDTLIGEGVGVLVNACGAGLLFDFALQPGESHPFSAPLELFEDDAIIDRIAVGATGDAVPPTTDEAPLPEGITQISSDEVVAVEWEDETTFRYAVGCERALFTEWEWRRYNLDEGDEVIIEHPNADDVTPELRERLRLTDPAIFANSRLRFAPIAGERLVYQDAINDIFTAAVDGRLQRRLHTLLNNYSLQGYIWLPENRFLAYYYGAYGDPVLYFTADAEGRIISRAPTRAKPSAIVPGVAADGRRAVIAGTFDGVTGYFFERLEDNFTELLFEAEVPSNNYPPPVPLLNEEGDRATQIYLVRPIDDVPHLQCLYRPEEGESELVDYGALPLNLAIDERAWSFLSPDERIIALAANGANGGLWLIDRDDLPPCGNEN
jgi:hypothetical protein